MTLHVAVSGWLLGPHSGANRRLLALLAHTGPLLGEGERVTVLHRADFAPPALRPVGAIVATVSTGIADARASIGRGVLRRLARAK